LHERCEILRELSSARNLAFRRRFVGKILPAITLSKEEELGECIVLTENYIHARISEATVAHNCLIHIRIDEARADGTWATLIR
jgi:tRNA A37 methylthiotransferase MiaB